MPINSTRYNMRTINSNSLSKLKEEKVVPLLEELFVLGVSNIIWEYYCVLENNILYVDVNPPLNGAYYTCHF
jgi:hypothetical protein